MTGATYAPHTEAWRRLEAIACEIDSVSIADLYSHDPKRFENFSVEAEGLFLDFSRQRLDEHGLVALFDLAAATGVRDGIDRMFAGERINNTEGRGALHVALRRPCDQPLEYDGIDVMQDIETERVRMRQMADALHSGQLLGSTGKRIDTVVNIGIGGSDLGIVMAVNALSEHCLDGLKIHCVSNVDGVALSHALKFSDPETTLFVICSKTFTTLETVTNARAAREWLLEHGGEAAVARQCVAVSTNHDAMDAFGIAKDLRFTIWDWVGGRYSLWSAVGLTIALAIGSRNFDAFLAGAHRMDSHFESAPFDRNLPVLLALLGVWNRNFLGIPCHAILPYDDHLARFPAYLQQLEMESNGKSVRSNGEPVESETCPVIWGEPGSNAQHSFFQLLHQGTDIVSADFLLPARSQVGRQAQQDLAVANCLAQVWALAGGSPSAPLGREPSKAKDPHRNYPGNRPSSLVLLKQLDPAALGALVALYEHKVYVQGLVWDVNPFDQFGVELGKQLANRLTRAESDSSGDPALISGALQRLRAYMGTDV